MTMGSRPFTITNVPRLVRRFGHVARAIEEKPPVQGTGPHFYMNKILDQFVQQKTTPITLRQLVFYERHKNEDRVLKSANYVRTELPIRLSHRIREFQKLPFIVGTNPHIQHIYDLYWRAFERFRKVRPITTMQENDAFCAILSESLEAHLVAIPRLALGISECQQHMSSERIDRFMNGTLRSRISRRVLAEQHLVLSEYVPHTAHQPSNGFSLSQERPNRRTTIFSSCSAHDTVNKCTAWVQAHARQIASKNHTWVLPEVHINGNPKDTRFTYVADHIEYILYQILSNSLRHVVSAHSPPYPPIQVTICSNPSDIFFRISDQGGGMSNETHRHLWSYGRKPDLLDNFRHVAQLEAKMSEHDHMKAQLGIGLPMSRVYAEYWGGAINVVSMDGWGTDAYLRIPKLGTQNENLYFEEQEQDDDAFHASSSVRQPRPFIY